MYITVQHVGVAWLCWPTEGYGLHGLIGVTRSWTKHMQSLVHVFASLCNRTMLVYPVPNAQNAKNAIFDCLDWLRWSSAIAQSENLPRNCRDLHSLVVPFSLVDEQGASSSMFHTHFRWWNMSPSTDPNQFFTVADIILEESWNLRGISFSHDSDATFSWIPR